MNINHGHGYVRIGARLIKHVDDIAVEKACYGDKPWLTIAEKAEAIKIMTARGLSSREIGSRIGMSARQVIRYRRSHIRTLQAA